MKNFDLSFLDFTFLSALDIFLVALIIFYIYNLIRGTIAVNIMIGLVLIYVAYLIVKQADMGLLTKILGGFINVGFLAIVIVFQQEIRRFLVHIGKNATHQKNTRWWYYLFGKKDIEKDNLARIKPIIDACKSMQKSRTGALIVFAKFFDEQSFQNSGELINSRISKRLLESIFQKHSPLHDGAVVISNNKIKSASCILPLTENDKLPPQFGLRHRAGIGISEMSDAVAVIISEETGEISFAKQGRVKMNVGFEELEVLINKDF